MKKSRLTDQITVYHDLRDKKWRIGTELTDEELCAIGKVTIQWALLEHAVLASAFSLSGGKVTQEMTNFGFEKRLKAWKKIIDEHVKETKEKKRLLALAHHISALAEKRHRISHGLWDWLPDKPEKIKALSFRPRTNFMESFDLPKLVKLGEQIAEINFELMYPQGFFESLVDEDGSIRFAGGTSRAVKLGIAQIVKADPLIDKKA